VWGGPGRGAPQQTGQPANLRPSQPWNKVYSEIAAHLRVDSTVQQHVRGHLRDFVAVTPRRNLSSWRIPLNGGL